MFTEYKTNHWKPLKLQVQLIGNLSKKKNVIKEFTLECSSFSSVYILAVNRE